MRRKVLLLLTALLGLFLLVGCAGQHSYTTTVIPPTCTQEGYTLYSCTHCEKTLKSDVLPALGHTPTVTKSEIPATCTTDGLTAEGSCEVCGEILQAQEIVGKLEHIEKTNKECVAPTCEEEGSTEERACSRCEEVLQEATPIPALDHTLEITKQGQTPTCLQTGLTEEKTCTTCQTVVQPQTLIVALGHEDQSGDCYCDRCDELYAPNMQSIASVEDLRKIKNDLGGVYQLTADISLLGESWTPLGGEENPFTGHFFGNGHTISGLCVNDCSLGGIFAYNNGTIHGVTLKDITVHIQDENAVCGGMTAYNQGTIVDCTLEGVNTLIYTVEYKMETSFGAGGYESGTKRYTLTFGGFCGVNGGTIENCVSKTAFSCTYNNTAEYTLNHFVNGFTCARYELKTSVSVCVGGIVGQNESTVKNCAVERESVHAVNVSAQKTKKHGCVVAEMTAYIGGIAGKNVAQINDCTAEQLTITKGGEGYKATENCTCGGTTGKITLVQDLSG